MEITYTAIGVIHSPFAGIEAMPIQPGGAAGIRGTVELLPEYMPGLRDLAGFSHLILLYHFHRVRAAALEVTPFLDTEPHGIFATRAPRRPNPIGLSVVRLISVENNTLTIENVDIVDGTPLLDIKPYVPAFDHFAAERVGWLAKAGDAVRHQRSDDRFG
jgi:tRNA-Thr(GGU) m(6)t(6)A37 methyltransferase TsaA